jgi:hypothetical protein
MLKNLIPSAVPFGVALLVTAGIRLFAGGGDKDAGRGEVWASIGAVVGFFAGWIALTEVPWVPRDALSRVLHIALGGALLGTALDLMAPRRGWRLIVFAVYAMGCGLASVMPVVPTAAPSATTLGLGLVLAGVWFAVAAKLEAMSAHPPTALVVALAASVGLGVLALIADDRAVVGAVGALALALAAVGVAGAVWPLRLGGAALLMTAGTLVALGWALAQRHPGLILGLALIIFVLYAERTAKRIPMPAAKIRGPLYVLTLAGICAIPIVLAGILTLGSLPGP